MQLTATELTDSRELFGDWAALRARIASDGYVFMRGLLDPDEVSAIGRAGVGHLQSTGWTEGGGDPVTADLARRSIAGTIDFFASAVPAAVEPAAPPASK